jgi:hypothetical protein
MIRGRLLVALLLTLVSVNAAATVVQAEAYAYDAPVSARIAHDLSTAVGDVSVQLSGSVGHLGVRPPIAGAEPTTPSSLCVATNNDEPDKGPVTPARAKELAEAMGCVKTNFRSHGQAVYKKGKSYISRDVDGHCGGVWKEASSPEDLASKSTRNGTYNADLTERIGD